MADDPPPPPSPNLECPLQIIKLVEGEETGEGDEKEKNYSFTLEEDNLDLIMRKIPDGMKVSVISVVGNFRTGKSFLLTFMLRFLRNRGCEGDDWQTAEGECLLEGNQNSGVGGNGEGGAHHSFEWRGGHERMTTGIWMYSEPFIHESVNGEKIAVLIVDTQGLFDNETTMLLTSCIFGLSTLMSSYQVYNVKERIAEDNLQQLALFSEYGRMALKAEEDGHDAEDATAADGDDGAAEVKAGADSAGQGFVHDKAFQQLEFLVRDWPNFEEDDTTESMLQFMDEYVHDVVMKAKAAKDLMETRDQITSCFEKISCFLLPHPGLKIPKKSYNGTVSDLDPLFRSMLTTYMRRLFSVDLEPKRIQGRQLTAPELSVYIKTYVGLFQDGRTFPEAKTVLQATAEANNRNALTLGVKKYTQEMDRLVGPGKTKYVKKQEFEEHCTACRTGAMELFDGMATMGAKSAIATIRKELVTEIATSEEKYDVMNTQRNPWQGAEQYILPMGIAIVAFVARYFTDACAPISSICSNTSEFLGHVYVAIFTLMIIVSAGSIKNGLEYFKELLPLLTGGKLDVAKLKTS